MALQNDDPEISASAVAQLKQTDSMLYRYNIGEAIVPLGFGGGAIKMQRNQYKSVLSQLTKIRKRAIKIFTSSWKANYQTADLAKAIETYVGKKFSIEITESGKVIWKNADTGIQVVQDPFNRYFRIENTTINSKNRHLDLNGEVPLFRTAENGALKGLTRD